MTIAFSADPQDWTLRFWSDAPTLTALTLMIGFATLPVLAAMAPDPRMFQGDSIWLKPLKFHVALMIYAGTLAFFARYLPQSWQGSALWTGYVWLVTLCIVAEMLWIGGAAAMGTGSHFNIATPFWNAMYAVMGLAAVTLTSASLVMGIGIWRNGATGLDPALHLAIAAGLILTFLLTVPVASTMASSLSHHVGAPVTGARVPVLGWSREVGDLRAPHFLATHALHGIPLLGLLAVKVWPASAFGVVIAGSVGFALLVGLMFAQALAGRPVF